MKPSHCAHLLLNGAVYLTAALLAAATLLSASCSSPPIGGVSVSQPRPAAQAAPASGPLRVDPQNPRYFTDGSRALYLTGSHTWGNLQDAGSPSPPPTFDYIAYLDFLQTHHHNFFRLWAWEQAVGAVWTTDGPWFDPMPYTRPGPGTALDGKPKFDLTQFNQAYFDRLRARVIAARERGMYVSIMLFNGWSVMAEQEPALGNPWLGHPFNAANNINGVDGDVNHDDSGSDTHTLVNPAVTAYQEAYVRKVIDTVNDLDNVLYEISNESPDNSLAWQYHMIDYVKGYEATKAKQHPVGMTGRYEWALDDLLNSHADWISPGGAAFQWEPQANDGKKVIINDTDHLWGEGGDRAWVWKSFTRGLNAIYMDCYEASFCTTYPPDDPTRLSVVANLGYTLDYAQRMNLAAMVPRSDLCSSQYCLANPAADGAEYLVYLPAGSMAETILDKFGLRNQNLDMVLAPNGSVTVDLSAARGELTVEWLSPQTGEVTPGSPVTGGAPACSRRPLAATPFSTSIRRRTRPPSVSPSTPRAAARRPSIHRVLTRRGSR